MHPLQFKDEITPVDSSRYGQMLWVGITNIGMVLFFLLIWPWIRLADRKFRRRNGSSG